MWDQGQEAPHRIIWLRWVVLTTLGGLFGFNVAFFLFWLSDYGSQGSSDFRNPRVILGLILSMLAVYFLLAYPLFFASLGQWFILRKEVAHARRWLWTGALGILFSLPYLLYYAFLDEYSNGQSMIFGTEWFWFATRILTVMALIYGGIVGGFQGWFVLRGYGARLGHILVWVIANAIAWGVGFPLGHQFVASLFHISSSPYPLWWIESVLIYGTPWLIIGIITGAVFIWLRAALTSVD